MALPHGATAKGGERERERVLRGSRGRPKDRYHEEAQEEQ